MRTETLRFSSYDGTVLQGDLVRAENERARALLIHGIQSYRDEYGFYSDMASSLWDRGCSTFRFDWRCHYKDSPVSLVQGLTLSGLYNDIAAASRQLLASAKHTESMEDARLTIIASSFGGGVGAKWAQEHAEKVSRVILCAPVLDYERDYLIDPGLLKNGQLTDAAVKELDDHGCVTTVGRPFSRALVNELRHFNPRLVSSVPITIIHGLEDTAEPFKYSEDFARRAADVDLIAIPDADHGFAEPGDENLDRPRTKANHRVVYDIIAKKLGL